MNENGTQNKRIVIRSSSKYPVVETNARGMVTHTSQLRIAPLDRDQIVNKRRRKIATNSSKKKTQPAFDFLFKTSTTAFSGVNNKMGGTSYGGSAWG